MSARDDDLGWSGRWIAVLVRLFPEDFRHEVGDDLLAACLDRRDEAAAGAGGETARAAAVLTTVLSISWQLIKSALAERLGGIPEAPRSGRPGEGTMKSFLSDVRMAWRSLRRTPVFTVTAALTVALGIGANAAIFAVVNAVILRPLPYERPDELVMIWEVDRLGISGDPGTEWTVSPANYMAWQERSRAFTDIAAFNLWYPTLSGDGPAEPVVGSLVTPNLFQLLGVRPLLGSGLAPEHSVPGNQRVVIIGHRLWQRRFGGDQDIVGRTIKLSGTPHTVIGVLPDDYRHPEPHVLAATEIWRPLAYSDPRGNFTRHLRTIARLAPGASLEMARRDIGAVARRLESDFPENDAGWGALVRPLREELFGAARAPLVMLLAGAGFVLLIVCANVANLVLARGHGRRREFAIRTSLGAGRVRLARQLIVENVLLTAAGGAVGLLSVEAGTGFLRTVQSRYISSVADIHVDAIVIALVLLLALLSGLIFGLLPVLSASRADLRSALNEQSAGSGASRGARRLRSGLVVVELVLATVLVVGAGLMARSFAALVRVPTGFSADPVLTFELTLPPDRYDQADAIRSYHDDLLERLRGTPGVENAALVSDLPFTTENRYLSVREIADPRPPGEWSLIEYRKVGSGYFDTMGINLISGRDLRSDDGIAEGDVPVVVNRELAARLWPDGSAVGGRIRVEEFGQPARVVGVVADILDDGFNSEAEPRIYEPFSHRPSRGTAVVLRSAGEPGALITAVRRETEALESEVLVADFRPMGDLVAETVADRRIGVTLAGAFSLLALLLAAVGIYGVMSYAVGARRREIGIRGALGAARSDVLGLVMAQSGRLTLLGTAVGLALAFPLMRLMSTFLFGVRPNDPIAFGVAPLVLVAVALAASYVPASRATRIQPVEALRVER